MDWRSLEGCSKIKPPFKVLLNPQNKAPNIPSPLTSIPTKRYFNLGYDQCKRLESVWFWFIKWSNSGTCKQWVKRKANLPSSCEKDPWLASTTSCTILWLTTGSSSLMTTARDKNIKYFNVLPFSRSWNNDASWSASVMGLCDDVLMIGNHVASVTIKQSSNHSNKSIILCDDSAAFPSPRIPWTCCDSNCETVSESKESSAIKSFWQVAIEEMESWNEASSCGDNASRPSFPTWLCLEQISAQK